MVEISRVDIETLLLGIVEGVIQTSLPTIRNCMFYINITAADVEEVIQDFKTGTFSSVKTGIEKLGEAISSIANDLDECVTTVHDVEALVKWAKTYKVLAYARHVVQDLIANYRKIWLNIYVGFDAYEEKDY